MQTYRVIDKAELITDGENAPRITSDGYLVAQCRVARTGVHLYRGDELGIPDKDIVKVYRPAESVFSTDSLASFAHKPVTAGHPSQPVNSKNYLDHSVGHLGAEVARDGQFVSVPLMLVDASAIDQVQNEGSELSAGYSMTLKIESGTTDTGESYDAIQKDISINHVALVPRGRAGGEVRIPTGDGWTDKKPKKPTATGHQPPIEGKDSMKVRTVIVDGLSVETTDAGAQAIEKLQGDLNAAKQETKDNHTQHESAINTLKDSHEKEIKAKDAELGKKDGEIAKLQDSQVTPEKVDALVADRAALIGKATQIVKDGDFTGKTDKQIKAMCVDSSYPNIDCKDKSEDYISALFDSIEVSNDQFVDVMSQRQPNISFDSAQNGGKSQSQIDYEKRINDGWRNEPPAAQQ